MNSATTFTVNEKRKQFLNYLSLQSCSWAKYSQKSYLNKGRGIVLIRGTCKCCGGPKVGYVQLKKNPWLGDVLKEYRPDSEIVVSDGERTGNTLTLYQFKFEEIKAMRKALLN